MLDTKMIELRDERTCIPLLCTQCTVYGHGKAEGWDPQEDEREQGENWLLARAGFGPPESPTRLMVIVTNLNNLQSQYDPACWRDCGPRTLPNAHRWIAEHWEEIVSGQVVDVRVILGEASEPAKSDRFWEARYST